MHGNPTQTDSAPRLYSLSAVAERLDVSVDTVRRLVGRGELGVVRIGASVRVPDSELAAFIERARGGLG
jgi:excisionase family DNA binding protein